MKIKNHEWFDTEIEYLNTTKDEVIINVRYDEWHGLSGRYSAERKAVMINKDDAVALAKHFKLTTGDLIS